MESKFAEGLLARLMLGEELNTSDDYTLVDKYIVNSDDPIKILSKLDQDFMSNFVCRSGVYFDTPVDRIVKIMKYIDSREYELQDYASSKCVLATAIIREQQELFDEFIDKYNVNMSTFACFIDRNQPELMKLYLNACTFGMFCQSLYLHDEADIIKWLNDNEECEFYNSILVRQVMPRPQLTRNDFD